MAHIHQVNVEPHPIERFERFLGEETVSEVVRRARTLSERLAGRAVWNINSTATGGGVAEMLTALLGYPRAYGIDARWAVIEGSPEFFAVTKRLHHAVQGSVGDGSPLGPRQRAIYEQVMEENADELLRLIDPHEIVILHDPQTAGLAPRLIDHGCPVIWRCHIGDERVTAESDLGWAFLSPYLKGARASIFSRSAYFPPNLSPHQTVVIPPSIDPFSAKSEMLDQVTTRAILEYTGLVERRGLERPVEFTTPEGVLRRVDRHAHLISLDGPPPWEAPLVLQVSRWDPLKDPLGVMDSFVRVPPEGKGSEAHLMLVGPEVTGVADDPEAGATFQATLSHWQQLPDHARRRVHLVALPTADDVENATIVNALQSHATVVVQKSLREGFGLTVTEAMWKSCPIVATRVGGIQDQIDNRVEGLLVDDPSDLGSAAQAIAELLDDEVLAKQLGSAARVRVVKEFLPTRHLTQYAQLIEECLRSAA